MDGRQTGPSLIDRIDVSLSLSHDIACPEITIEVLCSRPEAFWEVRRRKLGVYQSRSLICLAARSVTELTRSRIASDSRYYLSNDQEGL